MLSAKTTIQDHLSALEIGAEDYIDKPFHAKELKLKVKKILESRFKFRDHLMQSMVNGKDRLAFEPAEIKITSADEIFLKDLMSLMEENIENADFKIDELIKLLGMSRAVLYEKIKSLTGFTPKKFLLSYRMKRAAQLLATKQLLVSEVAYRVGFKDPKYFSKIFYDNYKVLPSDYGKLN